ncbi:MAG: insulinase family protein, partial [Phenylobacterium sp.]|uniref:M16 family metallopeptidase n=1 Tax=Phenylobacterium sp. TaxID=1871053 RepID=UPI00271F894C
YMILPLAGREGVSFRLLVWVGSQAETDATRGIAHFVEHMAFRSTRRFPDGALDRAMAQAGAAWGRDHNAFTSRWTTTYHLDLPTSDAAGIGPGLDWLRDVGDGLLFRPEEVAAERGVVLAERLDRLGTGDATAEQETAFHFRPEDTLSPAGAVATLNATTPEDLRAFHAKWYRPDRSLIVVTGDVKPEAMIAELERRLGGWAGAGARPRMPDSPAPEPPDAPAALVLAPVRLPTQSMACRNTPWPEADDALKDLSEDLRESVLLEIANRRLSRAAAATRGVFALQFDTLGQYDTRQVACIRASHGPKMGLTALSLAQATLRAFAAEGPNQGEIDAAIAIERARARGALTEQASVTAAQVADELVYSAVYGPSFLHPHQMMRQISRGAQLLTPERLAQAFAALWPEGTPPTLSVEDIGLTEAAVIAGWRSGEAAQLSAAFPPPAPLTYDFGPAGRVVRREALAQGATRLTFANGLVLNHMASDRAPGQVQLVIRMGPSARRLSARDFVAASAAAAILPSAGVQGWGFAALQELNADWDSTFGADLSDAGLVISARSFSGQVARHLALITAHLMAPGFDVEVADRMALLADSLEQGRRLDPLDAVRSAFGHAVWPDTAGAAGDPETYRRLTPEDLRAALTPHLTTGPAQLTLVGDISEAEAITVAAATLGARPPRPAPRPATERPPLDYSAAPAAPIEVTHQGPAERAAGRIYWSRPPVRVVEHQAAALVLSAMLENAVIEETRRRQGRTYSPAADLDGGLDSPDHIALYVEVTPEAQSLDEIRDAVLRTAESFVAAPPSLAALEQVRRPLLTQLEATRHSDAYWAQALASPTDWDTMRVKLDRLDQALTQMTPADLHALARPWLSQPPIIVLARPAASEGAAQ